MGKLIVSIKIIIINLKICTQSKALTLLKERLELLNKENKLIIENSTKGLKATLQIK